jgi:hypothetical protein
MLGGTISLMFYTITSHLLKTLSSFFILIIGFAFGFFIMHHNSGGVDHFQNPMKAIIRTLVMAVGEIEFNELYAAHDDDPYALAFTMALLVGLIVMGSLVLINLLIAIIVSDLAELRRSGHIQELVNKAQHIVHIESAMEFILCPWGMCKPRPVDEIVKICSHSQCKCVFKKMEPDIVNQLTRIVKRRK